MSSMTINVNAPPTTPAKRDGSDEKGTNTYIGEDITSKFSKDKAIAAKVFIEQYFTTLKKRSK